MPIIIRAAIISDQKQQTVLSINTWVFHRNTHIFGDDADVFDPVRWLDADRAKKMTPYLIHVRRHP